MKINHFEIYFDFQLISNDFGPIILVAEEGLEPPTRGL